MLRVTSFIPLMAGLLTLAALRFADPKFLGRPMPANSTVARFFLGHESPPHDVAEPAAFDDADSVGGFRVLMLNYTAYDSAYVAKVKTIIRRQLPGVVLTDFWSGSAQSLEDILDGHQVVVIPYPAAGDAKLIRAYGKVLTHFVQEGGAVVISGTDQFGILQHYGLFELDFGYFCSDLEVHNYALDHPALQNIPSDFSLANYVYPLDVSDPNFVVLADVRGYPALGYKTMDSGKVVYLGLEYYYDETISTRILENTLRWLTPDKKNTPTVTSSDSRTLHWGQRTIRRTEENLYVGSGRVSVTTPAFELKIYPNPYFDKGTLDINLEKPTPVSIEITDETGVSISLLLPYRMLNAGFYHWELPNVSPGVYFVKCQAGNQTIVRKVMKVAAH